LQKLETFAAAPFLQTQAAAIRTQLEQQYDTEIDILIADRRFTWIHQVVADVLTQSAARPSTSDQIDRIVTHRWLGIPIFLLVMWVVFKLTIDISTPLLDWLDTFINGPLTRWTLVVLQSLGLGETWLAGLVVDGILAGVGGLLAFVPVLFALYLVLAVLEDSGYMARAAFVMDGLMMKMGLPGKSFLPMMVGFGCSVPAVYATRTLENKQDRLLTALLVPFMSCGARLPVYVLFAAVFFPTQAGWVVFSIYLLGVLVAILLGMLLRKSLFAQKEQIPLLMELPPFRFPDLKFVWQQTWSRITDFIKNAASLILVASVVLWFLMAIPTGPQTGRFGTVDSDQSLFATISRLVEPGLQPLGFGSWEAGSALMTGFVAKELVITSLAQTYQPPTAAVDANVSTEDTPAGLHQSIYQSFTTTSGGYPALAGLAFMVFVLLYTPCVATVSAIRHEFGSGWMWRSIFGQLAVAWLAAFIVFQGGKWLILGLSG
jgi:ferrous iron transport protein B